MWPTSKEEIKEICSNHIITNYVINDDLSIDVHDDVFLVDIDQIPLKFSSVYGHFNISFNFSLASLEGSPKYVTKNFNCSNTHISSLKYSPSVCGGEFLCSHTDITSFEGGPEKAYFFRYSGESLTTMKGAPKKAKNFICLSTNVFPFEYRYLFFSNFATVVFNNTKIQKLFNEFMHLSSIEKKKQLIYYLSELKKLK